MKAELAAKEKLLQEYGVYPRKESITNSITQAVEKAKQIEEGLSADLNIGAYLGEAAEIYETEKSRLAAIKKRD